MTTHLASKPPAFSVVIPLYNKAKSISATVRSVLAQDVGDFEIIVVNDGSTDRGPAIVSGIRDRRLRIVHQKNAGVSAARNRGVSSSRAEQIVFLDADDLWQPTLLSTMRGLVQRFPSAGIYATGYTVVDRRGRHDIRVPAELLGGDEEGVLKNYFRAAWSGWPPIHTSSICMPKRVFEAAGGFPSGVHCGQDTALWAKVALSSDIVISRENGAIYNLEGPENNTRFRYYGSAAYFDYLGLLSEHPGFVFQDDLEKYVVQKMYDMAVTAVVHGDDPKTARDILRRVDSRHLRARRRLITGLLLLPRWTRRAMFHCKQCVKTKSSSYRIELPTPRGLGAANPLPGSMPCGDQ